jgi:hypothetical protein
MSMNDLTAPLGQGPKPAQRAIAVPAVKIVALALGLFLGAFVLWAVIAQDRLGGEPVAVMPADLHIAKKPPEVIAVPQAAIDTAATAPALPAAPVKSPANVTVTIIDGKTGAKREVMVATPGEPTSADTTGQLPKKR